MSQNKTSQSIEIVPSPNPVVIDLSSLTQDQRHAFLALATYQDSSKGAVQAEWDILIFARLKVDANGLVTETKLESVLQRARYQGLEATGWLGAEEP